MNDRLATLMAQHLINLPFITLTAGLVSELTLKTPTGINSKPKLKKLPASRVVYVKNQNVSGGSFNGSFNMSFNIGGAVQQTCEKTDDYYDLIPKTKETGIIYFEDNGSKLTKQDARKSEYVGTVVLVCWMNMKLIGDDYTLGQFINATIAQLPKVYQGDGIILSATAKVDEVLPNRPSPFVKYDYDESEKQFLMYPFDYFSLKIKTNIIINRLCETNITLTPQPC